jgi:hypothetical protein
VDELVQFLRDRLDEDFEAVRVVLGVNVMAAIRGGKPVPRWVPSPKGDAGVWDTDGVPRVKFVWARERDHIIRYDPARVLAEAEAKRRIVDLAAGMLTAAKGDSEVDHYGGLDLAEETLLLLARPFRDHPDFDPAWLEG